MQTSRAVLPRPPVLTVLHAAPELQRTLPHVRSGATQNVAPSLLGSQDTTHSPLVLAAAVAASQASVCLGGSRIEQCQNELAASLGW